MTAAQFGISASGANAPDSGTLTDQAPSLACTVRMAPQREPRFDDELPARHFSLLHPAPELPFPPPKLPTGPVRRRLMVVPEPPVARVAPVAPVPPVPPVVQGPSASGHPRPALPRRTGRSGAPDPTRFGRQFALGVVEVLSGRRPVVQLTRHVSPAVQRGLGRAGTGQQLRSAVAPVLHSVHLSEPADGVCEMSVIVAVGPRYRAVAARLEWKLDHWLCTALQVG